jgi:molybdopterin-guanine dinucleotide biosynthesis protein
VVVKTAPVNAAVLLAGGSARRVGVDKRLLTIGGRTLLSRNLAFLRERFEHVVVSVSVGQDPYLGDTPVEILPDAYPERSPLTALATALDHLGEPFFALAVDVAFPSPQALTRLLDAFHDVDVAVPVIGSNLEPLFAIYGPACLEPMQDLLERGRQRIVTFFPSVRVAGVPFADERIFRNINTMDDYDEARREQPELEAGPRAQCGPCDPCEPCEARQPALIAIVGKSDSGKTTLIEALLPQLKALGLRVATVKHDAHDFTIDHPGKDSWRHGQAGADAYVVSSPERVAYIGKLEEELPLQALAKRFFADVDLVVAEGYKRSAPHRIEIFRRAGGHGEPLCGPDETLALVTDADLAHEHRFGLDQAGELARFIVARLDELRIY